MGAKKHVVEYSDEDRKTLEWFISTGEQKSEDNTRARILLKANEGVTDSEISEHVGCHRKTVYNTGNDTLSEDSRRSSPQARPVYERKLDGNAEAHLIRLACSEPPEGEARWTLHLLADELVTLDEIDFESISHETVRQGLKSTPETTSLQLLGDSA